MINAEKGIFPKRIIETETSEAVSAAAPEHIIDIGYNGDEKQLTESEGLVFQTQRELMESKEPEKEKLDPLQERILARKEFNAKLAEAIKEDKVEEINNSEKPLGKTRYRLQKFTNGGTPYVDEAGVSKTDGNKGGPSQYEQWRYELNDKKRKARLERERDDANSTYHSPRLTQADPDGTIDNQIDQFLADYVRREELKQNKKE